MHVGLDNVGHDVLGLLEALLLARYCDEHIPGQEHFVQEHTKRRATHKGIICQGLTDGQEYM